MFESRSPKSNRSASQSARAAERAMFAPPPFKFTYDADQDSGTSDAAPVQARLNPPMTANFLTMPLHTPGRSLPVQPKLTIGQPGDQYEQEADRMASQVMRMREPVRPPIQRVMNPEEEKEIQTKPLAASITPLVQRETRPEDEKESVQTKPTTEAAQANPDLESQLNASKGGGSPLSDEVRSFMEPRFGSDFSQVKAHTDSRSVQMNQALGAQAFTHGSDIYFGSGKSPANNDLTAHELTHVVQQISSVQNKLQLVKAPAIVQRDITPDRREIPNIKVEDLPNSEEIPNIKVEDLPNSEEIPNIKVEDLPNIKETKETTIPKKLPRFEFDQKSLPPDKSENFNATYFPVEPVPREGTLLISLLVHLEFEGSSKEEEEKFEKDFINSVSKAWSTDSSGLLLHLTDQLFSEYKCNVEVDILTISDPSSAHFDIKVIKAPKGFRSSVDRPSHKATLDVKDPTRNEDHTGKALKEGNKHGPFDFVRQVGNFKLNSAEITPAIRVQLRQIESQFQDLIPAERPSSQGLPENLNLFFRGRASSQGKTDHNEKLAKNRAENVKKQLLSDLGWDDSPLYFVESFGEENASNNANFRRVDIEIIDTAKPAPNLQQNTAVHEAGHMFGLGDEYVEETPKDKDEVPKFVGDKPTHYDEVSKLMGKDAADELLVQNSASVMSVGGKIKRGHYVFFLKALNEITEKKWVVDKANL